MNNNDMIVEFAAHLHSMNNNWVTFFREVLGPDGLIYKTFPDIESRQHFEESPEYNEVLKMLADLVESGVKDVHEQTKEITVRVPASVHSYLQLRSKDEGYSTLSRFVIRKLMKGCFSARDLQSEWFQDTCPGGNPNWEECVGECQHPDCPRKKKEDGADESEHPRMVGNSPGESGHRPRDDSTRQTGTDSTVPLESVVHANPGVPQSNIH